MSLYVEIDDVKFVLLADGWHEVVDRSFEMDSYEFHHEKELRLGGGSDPRMSSVGARWTEKDGASLVCPATSILAIKVRTS